MLCLMIPSIFLEGLSIQSEILRILNQKGIFPGFSGLSDFYGKKSRLLKLQNF